MAKQTVNIGSSVNKGDGDPLRTAFDKINDNFDELYIGPQQLTQTDIDALTPVVGMMVYNTTTGKFQGYAADANNDSTAGWADLH
ncbi:MAG: hypothetical protein CMN33_07110 [Saprospirales bacterium]|nr:hypothetical protein [Saprospirales bacterium]|tara:strand:+ start:7560 stop:7814 length:255 start_codon:yes stop_codon:yes gene_type:complete